MNINKNMAQLEDYLSELESPDLDLNTAIDTYSKGLKLANKTLKDLEKSKLKITRLNEQE